jgi:hypothetical protein
MKETMNGGG